MPILHSETSETTEMIGIKMMERQQQIVPIININRTISLSIEMQILSNSEGQEHRIFTRKCCCVIMIVVIIYISYVLIFLIRYLALQWRDNN